MARIELINKRGPRSKTFANEDGTLTLEVGGGIAHHRKDDAWVDADCTLSLDVGEHRPSAHPLDVRLPVSFAQPLRVGNVSIRPLDFAKPPSRRVIVGQERVTYVQAYEGIDVERIVTPEGVVEVLHITDERGCHPLSWAVKGEVTFAPYYIGEHDAIAVPFTFADGVLTYDLSDVPVGAEVY